MASTHSSKSKKSPAFQFYPGDFLSSSKVDRMSMTERGAYITLLARCWLDDGLTTDLTELAEHCRMKPAQFERMWSNGKLGQCFTERNGRFHNDRLDVERGKQSTFSRRQSDNAHKRWHTGGNAVASSGIATALPVEGTLHVSGNALRSSSSSSSVEIKNSAEPLRDSTPAVLEFSTVGKLSAWVLTQGRLDGWQKAYPNVDVMAECRKASAWIEANPERRKTAKGMSAFLVNWLNRAADRPRPTLAATGTDTLKPAPSKYLNMQFGKPPEGQS